MLESTAEIGNMKDDEEFEMLLDEIPHATSHNHHHHHHQHERKNHVNGSLHGMYGNGFMYDDDPSSSYLHNRTCVSPVSGFSLLSDGSSSSLFSHNGQSLSDHGSPPPPLEDFKPHLFGELDLCRNFSKLYISNDQENLGSSFREFSLESNGIQRFDQFNVEKHGVCDTLRKGFSEFMPLSFNGGMAFSGLPHNLLGPQMYPQGMGCWNGTMRSPWQNKDQACNVLNLSPSLSNGELIVHGSPRPVRNMLNQGMPLSNGLARPRAHSNVGAFSNEDSFIIQGDGLNYVMINKGLDCSRGLNKAKDIGASKHREGRLQLDNWSQFAPACGNSKNAAKLCTSFSLPPKYNSLAEARGYIYLIAKDQHGCRFLQRLFDEGTREDVEMIFKEIIDHVVELMMNPFGNYLMQKLLEVCNEQQRMQILLMATEEPGQLVRISLNTHGTRVVQKLIETLKTRQQISLVVSALEPGFLSLIKDLNGNHVVQRCLQCLSCEDNKFIFIAAAKYCVDIATHQHGCCVLQRCISHSTGEYRHNLVEEISSNGLLLAQDAYGNYVVQFILELKIPSATSTLISQFEGNYVHLSSQKFSSHVVEKCLMVLNDESRSKLIHELLSTAHFERLLQDPHANYVVQTALRVSEGSLHNSLVEAIESHKAISRNSPYSKRILSQKLLKK
ncbi:hypothetical protein ES332_D01G013500v1 [Gossypium tomentosum]|uniref:PUM-HD domain-containing protein n=1 Tax=Gossypium tomentosum TaxID=34277 RepID=A0A5D2M402_GOSTO|nr:hypothetical protein ES332_D01G013500v1 [Gossypium tomentosum]